MRSFLVTTESFQDNTGSFKDTDYFFKTRYDLNEGFSRSSHFAVFSTQQAALTMTNNHDPARNIDLNLACIPSTYSHMFARELGLQRRDLPTLLRLTQLSTEQFLHDEALLTTQQQIQIIQNGLRMTEDPTLGLRVGLRLTPRTHGMMGLLVNSSPNLYMTLKAIQAFVPTRMHFARIDLKIQQDWLECHCHFDVELSEEVLRNLGECFAMAFFECAKYILGRPIDEAIIQFSHEEPDYSQRYFEYMPGKILFGESHIIVKIPLDVCYLPNASASEKNYRFAYQQCKLILEALDEQKGTSKYQLQKIMLAHPLGMFSEDDAAAELYVSKRTLARKLKEEGTSFREIRDGILSQKASSYLEEGSLSVEAIATLLNYHDSSNFRRAFKRWFNMTPDQYRKQLSTK